MALKNKDAEAVSKNKAYYTAYSRSNEHNHISTFTICPLPEPTVSAHLPYVFSHISIVLGYNGSAFQTLLC